MRWLSPSSQTNHILERNMGGLSNGLFADFCFFVLGMFTTRAAVFAQYQLIAHCAFVFIGRVVTAFTF